MTFISLSHVLENDMLVYPGENSPFFLESNIYEGFYTSKFSMGNHVGTHVDLPLHVTGNTESLESRPLTGFLGKGQKVILDGFGPDDVIPFQAFDIHKDIDFLLIETGWDKFWGDEKYFNNYPYFSEKWIPFFKSLNIKGIGTDTPSLDNLIEYPIHKNVLPKTLFYENLCHLNEIPDFFRFMGIPLKIKGAEASPVHCIAEF